MVRTQNFLSLAACGSGTRGSGTNAKFCKVQSRVVVVRKQNELSIAARRSGMCGSGARVIVTNAEFSKSSRAWK